MAVARGPSLGILGGVFDPPHVGHVALASAAFEQLRLSGLLVLVVADPGHKEVSTPAATRLELARLAFAGVPKAEVELDRHARTVDSLEARRPADAVFLIGADQLLDFPDWKSPERVLELVRLGVAMRPGASDDDVESTLAGLGQPDRVLSIPLDPIAVSSSAVRARVARGEPIDELVPPAVADAIERLGLYRSAE